MDRKTFFEKAFTLAVGKSLEFVEDNPIVRGLSTVGEKESDDGRLRDRPPGALEERKFAQTCTGCDRCMIACPHNVIMIEDQEARLPLIYPEESPCLHCSGYPCIVACDTGALSLSEIG